LSVRLLSEDEVRSLLDLPALIDALAAAHEAASAGRARNPDRLRVESDTGGALAAMPAFLPGAGLGIKALTGFPSNRAAGLPTIQAAVLLFSEDRGQLLAVLGGRHLTAARTAAAGGLSTRLLARPDARALAVLGAGLQAPYHILATLAVRPIERVRVASRDPGNAERLRADLEGRCAAAITVAPDNASAVRGADVVVACTSSETPVVADAWIAPGAHVVSVSSSHPTTQELDPKLVARSRFVTDSRAAALHELGDYLLPLQAGLIAPDHIVAELGELVSEAVPARRDGDEVTVYKSAGLAIQDLAAAALVYRAALARGLGAEVEL
jgi:alanine dehydrogenase